MDLQPDPSRTHLLAEIGGRWGWRYWWPVGKEVDHGRWLGNSEHAFLAFGLPLLGLVTLLGWVGHMWRTEQG